MNFQTRARNERRAQPVRRATLLQLTEQLFIVRATCQWLVNETHGESYDQVWELNELLHQANGRLRHIENGTTAPGTREPGQQLV